MAWSCKDFFVAEVLPDETSSIKNHPEWNENNLCIRIESSCVFSLQPVTEKLRKISARGLVGTDDDGLIGGFIVAGNTLANNAVVARAIGPSLSQTGVTSPLADPKLELKPRLVVGRVRLEA